MMCTTLSYDKDVALKQTKLHNPRILVFSICIHSNIFNKHDILEC